MTALATFADGAVFDDGAGLVLWRPQLFNIGRSRMLVFHDGATRPRFVDGLAASRLDRYGSLDSGVGSHARERVMVNPRAVARAVERAYLGQPGFLLERRNGVPFAWVPAAAWLEAIGR